MYFCTDMDNLERQRDGRSGLSCDTVHSGKAGRHNFQCKISHTHAEIHTH